MFPFNDKHFEIEVKRLGRCVRLWIMPWLKVKPYFESEARSVQYSDLNPSFQSTSQTDMHPNDGEIHLLGGKEGLTD